MKQPTAERAPVDPPSGIPQGHRKQYPWLHDPSIEVPKPSDVLRKRFAPPDGFTRRSLPEASFGAWLRDVPLAAPDSPVLTYEKKVLHPANDPRIVSVIAIDIGRGDLQQCADAVMRFHAEWKWSRGERDMSYRAAAGSMLPFARWARGERIVSSGQSFSWSPGAGRASSTEHASFRKYMDTVFAWANTVSLERQAKAVPKEEVRPGDFFILPGNPGHSVLILDIAERGKERVALLGQSYMPAQSPQVLSHEKDPWFVLDTSKDVATPFWRPFPWSSLRRLD